MAEELGVHRATLTRWMNVDGVPIRPAYLKQWALRCGTDYQWLATGWPSMLPPREEATARLRESAEARRAAGLPMDDYSDLLQAAEAGLPYDQWLFSDAGIAWLTDRGVTAAAEAAAAVSQVVGDPAFLHGNRPLRRAA
jgi:hypothetical protein